MAVYLEIATKLRDEIRDLYTPGDLLPPEKQLAERFSVNRHTLRRAVDELVQDGLVKRFQGLGNQVIQSPIDYALHHQSCFTFNLSEQGLTTNTEVIQCVEQELPQELLKRIKQPAGTHAVVISTCRYIDEQPTTLIRHHLFGVDIETMQAYHTGSLHQYLKEHYQFDASRGTTRLRARMPTFEECQKLGIGRGIPVMEIHSLYYLNASGDLMEYSISISRSDIFEYSLEP